MHRELILIKFGGSLITDKGRPFTARPAVMHRLVREIKAGTRHRKIDIIVAHGSGSFGHTIAARFKTQEGMRGPKSLIGVALVRQAASKLNEKVLQSFLKAGIPAVSFAPSSFIFSSTRKTSGIFLQPIEKSLSIGIVPVVFGDVVFDAKEGFGIFSGEKVISALAGPSLKKYRRIRVVMCGDTDGVYDSFGKTIPLITPATYSHFKKSVSTSRKTDVTGGMLHKVQTSVTLASRLGVFTEIINGRRPGELSSVLKGRAGQRVTLIAPGRSALRNRA